MSCKPGPGAAPAGVKWRPGARHGVLGGVVGGCILHAAAALSLNLEVPDTWNDAAFEEKQAAGRAHIARAPAAEASPHTVVGATRFYTVRKGDTLLDVARYFGLGYNEMVEANPGVDPWIPPASQIVLLPTQWVLPDVEFEGVVVNIPEMRLYYFHRGPGDTKLVHTFPVGLGRDDWRTPQGKFKIRGKTVDPTWVLPESIKEEYRSEGKPAPDSIPGGSPDNPLGKHRLELTLPLYAIHGTNIPWGVGMQVSHGCIRLYPEDIAHLFPMVRVGTPGGFVYQPVKVGVREGRIYAEVHKDIYGQVAGPYREALRLLDKFGWRSRVDLGRLERAVVEQSGVPMDITREAGGVQEETFAGGTRPVSRRP